MPTGPIKEISDEGLEVYSRQIVLKDIGYEGQLKLLNAKVCLVGLGGLGCPSALQLTAMGVGHLRIVDRDVVERSNLHRQHLYDVNSLYYPKVEVAARKLKELNPDVEVEALSMALSPENADKMVQDMDVVVDGLDAVEPRYVLNWACIRHNVPYIFGAAIEAYGNISTIIPGKTPCLECFNGGLTNEMLPACGVVGVHPSILNIISSLQVAEAVRIILGREPHLANTLLYCDLRDLSFDRISIARREGCQVCGPNPLLTVKRRFVEELCGRGGKRSFAITPRTDLKLGMKNLYHLLDEKQMAIRAKGDLGATFSYGPGVTVSLLKSGVMIVEGTRNEEEVKKLYREVVSEGLGIPWSDVE